MQKTAEAFRDLPEMAVGQGCIVVDKEGSTLLNNLRKLEGFQQEFLRSLEGQHDRDNTREVRPVSFFPDVSVASLHSRHPGTMH